MASAIAAAADGPLAVGRGEFTRPTDAAAADTPVGATASEKLFAHGFESWPGPWALWTDPVNGPGWGRTSYRKSEGTYSAYCAGSKITAPGLYANNMYTWMTIGPFNLSQFNRAQLTFDLWIDTEKGRDFLGIGVSTNNDVFETLVLSGSTNGWLKDAWIELSDLYEDGAVDFTGKPQVWIAFIFESDQSVVGEGAYVDNVRLSGGVEAIASPVPVTAVAGATRFDTAVQAAKLAYPDGAGTVVIATGRNWPDALGGSALAGVLNAPILLTERDALPASVLAEIRSLEATHAIILGGTAAVGTGIENALKAELAKVERIAGNSRYETADKVARRVIAEQGTAYDGGAFVATGGNFPDALAAAPLAAAKGWPLYLANPASGLSADTRSAMDGVTDVRILGSTGAVPKSVEWDISDTGRSVMRIGGATRYATAAWIAAYGVDAAGLGWDGVGVATGENYPDALAGGVLQAKAGSVMLLTPNAALAPEARGALQTNRALISRITIFGGLGALGQRTRNDMYMALSPG
jgi:putative cell wall-binding protein